MGLAFWASVFIEVYFPLPLQPFSNLAVRKLVAKFTVF
jgi:hypothetical protein